MLKKRFIILISLMLISVLFIPSVKAEEELNNNIFYELIKTENEKPEVNIPDFEKVKFDNGLTVYLVKDTEYQIVEVTGFIKGGRSKESIDIAGISDIMVKMMSTGTQNFGEEEYAREKEIHGIDINIGVSNDTFNFRGSALSSETEDLLSLLADSIKYPEFEAPYLQRILQEQYQYLAQEKVQPNSLLNSNFFKVIYDNHPYSFANNIELKSSKLLSFNPKKLKNFYNRSIGPEKMVIAVVGDINIEKSKNIIEDNFADWQKQGLEVKRKEIKSMTYNENEVIIVDKKDADQAHMKTGHNSPGYDFEKYTEFLIGNKIFGQGGFSSRLMKEIRSEKGFVYSIYSGVSYNKNGGVYYIDTKVNPEKAPEVLSDVKKEMMAIKNAEKEITEKEVSENINLYNGLLPSNYKYPINIINDYIYETELLEKEGDYLNNFIDEYNNLTASEVQSVMADNLHPDKLLTVVVGNSQVLKTAFKEAGYNVRVIKSK